MTLDDLALPSTLLTSDHLFLLLVEQLNLRKK